MLAHEIRARVARGEVSPLEVAQAYLKRVQELDPGLGAFLSLNERLLEEAEAGEVLPTPSPPDGRLTG